MTDITFEHEPVPAEQVEKHKIDIKPSRGKKIRRFVGRFVLILLETVLLLAVALYGVMFVLAKGPSPTARDVFC